MVDNEWATKLAKIDSRFKFAIIDTSDQQAGNIVEIIKKFEPFLELSMIERLIQTWETFLEDTSFIEIDKKSEVKIRELKLDFLLCDQVFHLPAMQTGVPYAFIVSANPLLFMFDG